MPYRCPHFRTGIALTLCCAVLGLTLARLPFLEMFGPLTITLLLGMLWRAFLHVPEKQHLGIGFSSKTLLRWGIVLLGVRIDFDLLAKAGVSIFILGLGVIILGLFIFNFLGKRFGLKPDLAMLIAIDSSICGASAVAAAAPVLKAKEEDTALVIPIGSIFGSIAVIFYTFLEHWIALSPKIYGILTGATLHEIAQVMAASQAVPGAIEAGTITKLMRVLLLVPVIFLISLNKLRHTNRDEISLGSQMWKSFPWFILWFLAVGTVTSLIPHLIPHSANWVESVKVQTLTVSVFLMAMAMAGVGLQVNFIQLRESGLKAIYVAVIGWVMLAGLAYVAIYFMGLRG